MTRRFYADPLAAAWMAARFEMAFLDGETNTEIEYRVTYALMMEGNDLHRPLSRYFVHPDSLHLLKPQLGDLVGVFSQWYGDQEPFEQFILLNERQMTLAPLVTRIVQRNGVPFHWPEADHG